MCKATLSRGRTAVVSAVSATLLIAAWPAEARSSYSYWSRYGGYSDYSYFDSYRGSRKAKKRAEPKAEPKSVEKSVEKTEKKTRPAFSSGPLHIVVSLNRQRVSLFSNGKLVSQAPVSSGTPSNPTPMGVFSVIQKNRDHVSNLYDAPMPYMQRLTWSGTALHQGALPGYPASHGCIRLPMHFAQLLWRATRIGARVIVTRDEVAPAEFAHPRLFTPAPKADEEQPVAQNPLLVKTADGTSVVPGAGIPDTKPVVTAPVKRPAGPVSVFVSRKDGKLYVRQGMEPVFDVPVTIKEPERAIGTHVYTAMELQDGGSAMRWTVISIPSSFRQHVAQGTKRLRGDKPAHVASLHSPAVALDRIEIPQDAAEKISAMLSPGSSLIVSDNGISHETGKGTDFIVLTH
jgi:lipoprotein-anchoring transpeptidase ErfK/SrfK